MENKIILKQKPVITHQLQEAGRSIQKRIDDLELDKQVATEDNVKSMKSLRAELNNEAKDYETQRGLIKKAVNEPYLEFEQVYKIEITDRYNSATEILKNQIDFVEDKIKRAKKEAVVIYFTELCQSEKIDFLTFENLGIEINLSVTEKKYKEQVSEFISLVIDNLNLIKTQPFEAEILTEYKLTLNVSKSITDVQIRKDNEAKETAKIQAENIQNRKTFLQKLGLIYDEITNCFVFNTDIYITISDINLLSKDAFTKKYAEIEAKVLDIKSKETAVVNAEIVANNNCVVKTPETTLTTPILAPVAEIKKELVTASFEITNTIENIYLVRDFMIANGIDYKNI